METPLSSILFRPGDLLLSPGTLQWLVEILIHGAVEQTVLVEHLEHGVRIEVIGEVPPAKGDRER